MNITINDEDIPDLLHFYKGRAYFHNYEVQKHIAKLKSVEAIVNQLEAPEPRNDGDEEHANAFTKLEDQEPDNDFYNASEINTEPCVPGKGLEIVVDQHGKDVTAPSLENKPRRQPRGKYKPRNSQPKNTIATTKKEAATKLGVKRRLFKKPVEEEPKRQRAAPAEYSNKKSLYPELENVS